jgi:hypothetical protein
MKKLLSLIALVLVSFLAVGQNLADGVDNQVLLTPQFDAKKASVEDFLNFYNIEVVSYFDQLDVYVVKSDNFPNFATLCQESGLFSIVERDKKEVIKHDYIPNDPEFSLCWHLKQTNDKDIDADEAWDLLPGENPWVSVAMFDGGLDMTIPEFVGNVDSPFNAVNGSSMIPYVNSEDKHGTTCSGTIAAVTNNNTGVSSVGNNKVKVMPVNIMAQVYAGGSFSTSSSIQIAAVNAAMSNPNCVAIAMSYGGSSYSATLDAAFVSARTNGRGGKGMMVFASSGNGYSGTAAQFPANYSGVWGVGATTSSDLRASFSNFGQICDISAPGSQIRTVDRPGVDGYNSGDYTSISGTSFSCPITAAASAVLAYKNWELTDDEILQILSQTCEKVGGYTYSSNPAWPYSTRSNELGYGRINLKDAVLATPNPGGTPPPPPTPIHNFVVNNLSVSPVTVNLGNSVTVNYNAVTSQPTLQTVSVPVEYRYSANSTLGDSDDVIIGTDNVTLGGGIGISQKSFSYNVGGLAGVRYIYVIINYNNTVEESMTSDNASFRSFSVNDPAISGADVRIELVMPASNPFTTSLQIVNCQWRAVNTGSVPVTQINYTRRWVTCTSNFGCITNVTWTGNLLPGQSVTIPGTNSYVSMNLCHPLFCAVPVGSSNTLRFDVVSVNGGPGDADNSNNRLDLVFNRISTNNEDIADNGAVTDPVTTVEDEYPLSINIYTITGMLLDVNRFDELASGIYIVKENYRDHSITYKISK